MTIWASLNTLKASSHETLALALAVSLRNGCDYFYGLCTESVLYPVYALYAQCEQYRIASATKWIPLLNGGKYQKEQPQTQTQMLSVNGPLISKFKLNVRLISTLCDTICYLSWPPLFSLGRSNSLALCSNRVHIVHFSSYRDNFTLRIYNLHLE